MANPFGQITQLTPGNSLKWWQRPFMPNQPNLDPGMAQGLAKQGMLNAGLGLLRASGQGRSFGEGVADAFQSAMGNVDQTAQQAYQNQILQRQLEQRQQLQEAQERRAQAQEQREQTVFDRTQQRQQQVESAIADYQSALEAGDETKAQLARERIRLYGGPDLLSSAGMPGSLQELQAINADRAAQGQPPLSAEEYLTERRQTSAQQQAYNRHVEESRAQGLEPMAFSDFTANLSGRVRESQTLGEVGMKRFDSMYEDAAGASGSLRAIQEGAQLIEEGIITGTTAEGRTAIARGLDTILGRQTEEGRLAANTDAYLANAGQLVAERIKAFGAGTGLSDADRAFAERMAGGSVAMTEAALKRILEINYRAAKGKIDRYNERYEKLSERDSTISDLYDPFDIPEFEDIAPWKRQGQLPEGVTEEDVEYTMRLHGLTREQVLERMNAP